MPSNREACLQITAYNENTKEKYSRILDYRASKSCSKAQILYF